ncbi:helix-turn-helix transcriptional regulator [[Clostridium] symbiosum]|uniref:PadR family transcriptional regulator n=1 Tax=Clostridium symbiosum TaxID=1512 RepID=UPI001D0750CE|nr:helix-turn-helix transcriptional regulator [[Clostridium] symbiosum]MCB6608838.1 PadR family transcriptional regulator [[Clostridium] symbiosum]MCB6929560.1 PadR family transcriptional regulator [[Clostridium] symbiosum]
MAREQFQSLTEQMYYILLALLEPRCGVDISRKAMEISRDRIQIGPGTLYTLLAKFEKEDMIQEVKVEGRKKYYQITVHGRTMLQEEYRRLETLVEEGREYMRGGSL